MAPTNHTKRLLRRTRHPFLEALEDRALLSISLPPAGTSGPVTLTGTPLADQFVMRLQPGAPANVQFSDNGGASFAGAPLANVTGVTVLGLSGRDTLTIDHGNGLVAKAGGLNVAYDGGQAPDFLVLAGSPGPAVSQIYQIGATSDAGTLLTTAGGLGLNVAFSRVSAVLDTVPAAALAVNLNDLPNLLKVEKDVAVGSLATLRLEGVDQQGRSNLLNDVFDDSLTEDRRVESRDTFVPLTFAAKSNVTINLLGGDDLIVLDSPQAVSGLVNLMIDGGAGTDRVVGDDLPLGVTTTLANVERNLSDAVDDKFLLEMYTTRVRRVPTEAELENWRPHLRGEGGRPLVVAAIERAQEARTRLVTGWYENYLGRPAGGGEEQGWVNALVNGSSEEQILAGILASREFYERAGALLPDGPADDRFIRVLYTGTLNRAPAPAEVQAWVERLPSLGRGGAALGFLGSREFRGRVVDAYYTTFLNRTADDNGREGWVGSGLDLSRMREGFQSSLEFYDDNRAGAARVQLDTNGRARLTGTSVNHDDKHFFLFTPTASGTLGVNVQTTNGKFAKLQIENGAGVKVFETEPNDGVNSGSVTLQAGVIYFLRLRSPDSGPAAYVVDLTFGGGTTPPPGGGGGAPPPGGGASSVTESEPNDAQGQADFFVFSSTGTARLQGTSANRDDRDFFTFTAPRGGTLRVTVQTSNGRFAQAEVESAASVPVLETEPNNGVNTANGTVQAGVTYFVRLRSPDNGPAAYTVDLSLV